MLVMLSLRVRDWVRPYIMNISQWNFHESWKKGYKALRLLRSKAYSTIWGRFITSPNGKWSRSSMLVHQGALYPHHKICVWPSSNFLGAFTPRENIFLFKYLLFKCRFFLDILFLFCWCRAFLLNNS